MKRIIFTAAALALTFAAIAPPAAMAQVNFNLVVGQAPPALRYERAPAPRRGYIWAPGYWNWVGNRHVWEQGRWEAVRNGETYQAAQWRQDRDGWHLIPGGWQRAYVQAAPPAVRYEAVPAPRRGYLWAPGHWEWQHNRHSWVGGTWIRERPGYRYEQPNWVQREGRWQMEGGRWNRGDQDHDGVPNSRDRDRDGDGVPNRQDRRPDNPRRN